ncbi:MAG TPA: DUF4214 domain-containing protein [Acidimicrobiales bacterium]|nr:DUF4214 domain-containing protein [Acidimicrobiales bacterium]
MRLRLVLSAAGITAASLVSSGAVTAAPSTPSAPAAASTAPTAPRTPSITRGNGRVTVTWTAPASTGGSPITSYRVRVQPGHGAVTVAAPATTATVTGLADGTQVTATVEAVNALGTSPVAAAGTAIPSPPIAKGLVSPYIERQLQDLAVAPDQTLYATRADGIYERPFGSTTFTKLDLGPTTPWALAVGAGGQLYWADQVSGRNVIREYANGQVRTVAGSTSSDPAPAPSTTPIAATSASLPSVLELAVNHSDGSVFILDHVRHTVARFTVGGTIAVVAGVPTIGPTGSFSGDGGPAVDAHFDRPQGLAISEYGTVYVGDTGNDRVRAFTVGGTIQTVAGNGTETIDPAADLDATATGVPHPARMVWMPTRGLLVDSDGRKRLLPGDQTLTGRLQRIGDDAFDRALLDSTAAPGNGPAGTSENTASLAWDGTTLWGIYVVPDGQGWRNELRAAGPWLPSGAPTAHPGFGSWADLVTLHFRAFVNRPPTAAERSTWVTPLTNGTKAPGDLDGFLRTSKENLTNVDPVVRLYRAFLGRAPDANGLRYWIAKKRAVAPAKTWTVTQLANQFTASSEFQRKYGALSNKAFVTRIYTDVLGRPADPNGVTFWTKQLDTKRRTRATVMVGFSESPEYKRKQAANTDVAIAYLSLVGRMPTTEETATWNTAVTNGKTNVELLDQLVKAAPTLI